MEESNLPEYEEIQEIIEGIKKTTISKMEQVETPESHQNIYYRTEDKLPTREDADNGEELLVSEDRRYWYLAHYMKVKDSKYLFWAPVPKVEAKV